ncbi:MAG: 4Fe-4S dicluster domain-containing protein [Chloroflexota bacterium]
MGITRRDFIRVGGLGLLGLTIIPGRIPTALQDIVSPGTNQQVRTSRSDSKASRWRFVVDIRKCIGCGRCVKACKLENDVPLQPEYNRTWVERYVVNDSGEVFVDSPNAGIDGFSADYLNTKYQNLKARKSFFVPKLCNQCQRTPCIQVCPVGATYHTKEGIVLVDRKACIGCRYCIQACPYGARFLDPRLKVADKCTWCYHRITRGLLPACVEACPVGARVFGDITDPESTVSSMTREEPTAVLKPDLGTEPSVDYIGLDKVIR